MTSCNRSERTQTQSNSIRFRYDCYSRTTERSAGAQLRQRNLSASDRRHLWTETIYIFRALKMKWKIRAGRRRRKYWERRIEGKEEENMTQRAHNNWTNYTLVSAARWDMGRETEMPWENKTSKRQWRPHRKKKSFNRKSILLLELRHFSTNARLSSVVAAVVAASCSCSSSQLHVHTCRNLFLPFLCSHNVYYSFRSLISLLCGWLGIRRFDTMPKSFSLSSLFVGHAFLEQNKEEEKIAKNEHVCALCNVRTYHPYTVHDVLQREIHNIPMNSIGIRACAAVESHRHHFCVVHTIQSAPAYGTPPKHNECCPKWKRTRRRREKSARKIGKKEEEKKRNVPYIVRNRRIPFFTHAAHTHIRTHQKRVYVLYLDPHSTRHVFV